MNIKLNPDSIRRAVMQEEARKIAHEAVVDQIDDKARSYDTAIAYVLHTEFGFGEQRISRFLRAVVDAHVYTRERYGVRYQDSAYYQLLRRDGIDMEKIEDELDEYANERGAGVRLMEKIIIGEALLILGVMIGVNVYVYIVHPILEARRKKKFDLIRLESIYLVVIKKPDQTVEYMILTQEETALIGGSDENKRL